VNALAVLAAVVAVLGEGSVSFFDTSSGAMLQQRELGDRGVALFAAPDGRVLVPLQEADATAVASVVGKGERWPGRLFPLFFDEYDRMYVVLPGELVALSYPERAPLFRRPVPGLGGAWRAASSADGRVVAVVPAAARAQLLVVAPGDERFARTLALANPASAVAVGPAGGWVVVGEEGGAVEVLSLAGSERASLRLGGEVRGMALSKDGSLLVVALVGPRAPQLVGVRIRGPEKPLQTRFASPLGEEPVDLALTEEEALVLSASGVTVFSGFGRKLRGRFEVQGGRRVVVLPAQALSVVPDWGDRRER